MAGARRSSDELDPMHLGCGNVEVEDPKTRLLGPLRQRFKHVSTGLLVLEQQLPFTTSRQHWLCTATGIVDQPRHRPRLGIPVGRRDPDLDAVLEAEVLNAFGEPTRPNSSIRAPY